MLMRAGSYKASNAVKRNLQTTTTAIFFSPRRSFPSNVSAFWTFLPRISSVPHALQNPSRPLPKSVTFTVVESEACCRFPCSFSSGILFGFRQRVEGYLGVIGDKRGVTHITCSVSCQPPVGPETRRKLPVPFYLSVLLGKKIEMFTVWACSETMKESGQNFGIWPLSPPPPSSSSDSHHKSYAHSSVKWDI